MHCSDEDQNHSHQLVKVPSLGKFEAAATALDHKETNDCFVPVCSDCGAPMKPHTKLADEPYGERYYRADTVKSLVERADCLLVVGSSLKTDLCQQITSHFCNNDLPVIEVNVSKNTNRGKSI